HLVRRPPGTRTIALDLLIPRTPLCCWRPPLVTNKPPRSSLSGLLARCAASGPANRTVTRPRTHRLSTKTPRQPPTRGFVPRPAILVTGDQAGRRDPDAGPGKGLVA